jgi:curved DNA-binding protein CbpA
MIDHYRILGLPQTADPTAIRAAYLSAMRRHHPDQNSAPEAVEQAKLISIAYATLSDPQRRCFYDQQLASRTVPMTAPSVRPPVRGRGAFLAMTALAVALVAFAATRPPPQRLRSTAEEQPVQVAASRPAPSVAGACPTQIGDDQVRRALFGGAGRRSPADSGAFDHAARSSEVRVTAISRAGSELLGTLRCQATVMVNLPSGVTSEHGSRRLMAEVSFAPQNGGGALMVEADELLTRTLQTVTRRTLVAADNLPLPPPAIAEPAPPPPRPQPAPITRTQTPAPIAPAAVDVLRTAPRRPPAARPTPASTRSNLPILDRHQTLLYNQSYLQADERKRALLLAGRDQFLTRLRNCTSDECRTAAYLQQNQQIVAIMRN